MNILDTFYILFKADTSNLDKGRKDVDKGTKDLQQNIKSTNADTLDLAASFVDMATKAAAALGIVVSVGAAVKGVFSAEKQALNIGLFSKNVGIGVQQIDALSQATQRFGGSMEGALATAKQVQLGLTFQTPYGGAGDFTPMPTPLSMTARQYGIKAVPGMTVKDFYDEVNKRFQGLPSGQSLKIGAALGLDDSTILMLQQTTTEYNRIYKESEKIGLITQENTERAFRFYLQWENVAQKFRNIGVTIGSFFISPEALKGWYDLGHAIVLVGVALTSVFMPAIAMAIGAFAIANAPILIVIASIGALWALFHYGPELVDILTKATVSFFKETIKWIQVVIDDFKGLFGWMQKGVDLLSSFSGGNKISKDGQSQIDQYNKQDLMLKAAITVKAASNNPLSSQNSVSGNTSSNSVKIDQIHVHTQATDSEGIASSINDSLRKHINSAINNFNTSVLA